MKNIFAGMLGALVIVLLLVLVIVWIKPFNYQAIYILNPQTVVADSLTMDALSVNQISVLRELEDRGILLTPHEYTSHITSYYNTLIGLLIGLFILFSFISFWSIKNTAHREIEEAKNAIEKEILNRVVRDGVFLEKLKDGIIGRVQDIILAKSDKQRIDDDIEDIVRKQIELEENVNLLFDEIDAQTEIK